jgi:hypothetical protein
MTQTTEMLESSQTTEMLLAAPNAARFCISCGYALERRLGGNCAGNCANCDRPEPELVKHVYGVYLCVNKERCSRAQVGTAIAPRPFVCKTCHEGDVEGKDGVMLDAKEITRLIVGPGHCECGERIDSCARLQQGVLPGRGGDGHHKHHQRRLQLRQDDRTTHAEQLRTMW